MTTDARSTSSNVAPILKAARFWIFANLAGIAFFLLIAKATWNLDFALGGLSIYNGLLNVIPFLYAAVNLIWGIMIIVRLRRAKNGDSLVLWLVLVGLWGGAIGLEYHVAGHWSERAREAVHGSP
jgi:hypothetical protein